MPERGAAKAKAADAVLAKAVDVARAALAPIAHHDQVGDHLSVSADGQRLASHYFECLKPGYRGWRWVATLARAPRARTATVCEIALMPGPDSLLAPPWVAWQDRLEQHGDEDAAGKPSDNGDEGGSAA